MSASRIALLVSAMLLALLLAEGLLRLLGLGQTPLVSWQIEALHRPDPDLIYSLVPKATGSWRSQEFVESVQINSSGMRDVETPERVPGDRRVLILGDSMTFGHGVADDETYPNRLEALYRREGQNVHVLNAGVRGYGTDQAFRYFQLRLRALEPDLLILGFYINDVSDNIERALYAEREGELVALDATRHRLYRVGRSYEGLPGFARRSRLAGFLIPRLAGIGAHPDALAVRPPSLIGAVRGRIALQLRELEKISREDDFRLLLLAVPYKASGRDEYRWLHAADLGGVSLFDPSSRPAWRQQRDTLFFREDDHLTPAGNQRLAEQLHRFIDHEKLLYPILAD